MNNPTLPLAAAAAAVVLSAPAASACVRCFDGHPADHVDAAARVDAYNANLTAGLMPVSLNGTSTAANLAPGGGTQQVFLDFSQAVAGVFSAAERQAVVSGLTDLYAGFDVDFTLTAPAGEFTQVTYDGFGLGGVAVTGIDFRNVQTNDLAFVGTNGLQGRPSADQVNYAVNVGGHELGHTLGLRHHDSFGPIGFGLPATNLNGSFLPSYPGPQAATEFPDNTMSTPAFGGSFDRFFDGPTALGERSLTKLQFAEQGLLGTESAGFNDTVAAAQPLPLSVLDVPNTRPAGTLAGDTLGDFLPVRAGALAGSFDALDGFDVFSIDAFAGDFLSVEVVSNVVSQRLANTIDGNVTVLDAAGVPLDYYGAPAFNEDEIETFDPWIFDLVIPADGTYFVQVGTFGAADTGDYELFVTSFGTIPEPATLALLALSPLALLRRRR